MPHRANGGFFSISIRAARAVVIRWSARGARLGRSRRRSTSLLRDASRTILTTVNSDFD
jgi:hypothetical protein